MKLRLLQQVILASCIVAMLFLASMPVMAGYWDVYPDSASFCELNGKTSRSYPVSETIHGETYDLLWVGLRRNIWML
jgi:hypothetical protein